MKPFHCNDCKHDYQRESIQPCPACGSSNVTMLAEKPQTKLDLSPVAFLKHMCSKWKAAGYTQVIAHYDGSGDEGNMQGVRYVTDDGESFHDGHDLPTDEHTQQVDDAFEALAWKDVSGDNEGGGGSITVDVATGKVTRQEYYYENTTTDMAAEEVTEENAA